MKTGINLSTFNGKISSLDVIPYVKNAGFDACFWDAGEHNVTAEMVAKSVKEHKLIFQSIHAPFGSMNKMWETGEEGDRFLKELIDCLHDCANSEVPIMICHAYIGFGEQHPNDLGIERFGKLLREAEKLSVKVAFENTEGEKYLEYIKNYLWDSKSAGFCIDTGHEMCYNRRKDMIGKYGDKLIATHINDNMGVTGDEITWMDDSHMLPFDGTADWESVAQRIAKTGFSDILTLELLDENKPNRNTHERYKQLSVAEFLSEAHKRALKLAELIEKYR